MSEKSRQANDHSAGGDDANSRPSRSGAEWVTLAISATLVLGLVALTIYNDLTTSAEPAMIEVEFMTGEIWQAQERFYLPLTIRNAGGEPASDVTIEITLAPEDGEEQTGEFTIAFLDANETASSVVTFDADPSRGELSVSSLTFNHP